MLNDNFFIDDLIEKSKLDLENKLPDYARVNIRVEPSGYKCFTASTTIKGLGKTIVTKVSGEDCYSLVRNSKRKALSRAQNQLRKKRSRWRKVPFTPPLMPTAS